MLEGAGRAWVPQDLVAMSARLPPPFALPPQLVDGPSQARAEQLVRVFKELKRAVKQMAFHRHRRESFAEWMGPALELLAPLLDGGPIELKLEVSTVFWGDCEILQDDFRELNLIYPLWQDGVRLVTLLPGVEVSELVRFFGVVAGVEAAQQSDDLLTRLWTLELAHIDWVVLTDFVFAEGDDAAEVEAEVDRVLSYLRRELQSSHAEESLSLARVPLDELDLKLGDIAQLRSVRLDGRVTLDDERQRFQEQLVTDEARLLEKFLGVLFQAIELPTASDEHADIESALEQLLDGLLLEGKFGSIEKVHLRLEQFARRPDLAVTNRELCRACSQKLLALAREEQRLRAVGTALSSGVAKNLEGVKAYLVRLGPSATAQLLDLLDSLTAPHHRRLVIDVLIQVGHHEVSLFASRLPTAPSNLAEDLLYIIDTIDPPNKLELFAEVLRHENAALRMEGLTAIGRNRTQRCYKILEQVLISHDVPQMRAHAARLLAGFPPEWGAMEVLLTTARAESFEQRPDGEKRAVLGALASIEHDDAVSFLRGIFAEKSGLLLKRRVDERKLMTITALSSVPTLPMLQLLADIARNSKHHSREVVEAARVAALAMKSRLLNGGVEGGA